MIEFVMNIWLEKNNAKKVLWAGLLFVIFGLSSDNAKFIPKEIKLITGVLCLFYGVLSLVFYPKIE